MKTKYRPPVAFTPQVGRVYRNHGGGEFCCLRSDRVVSFVNIKSEWTFNVRGPRRYPDGTIDWQWSYGGRFVPPDQ